MNYRSAKELLEGVSGPANFNSIAITLASPESIRAWSWGEVKNPETINYRTYKPERGGLFCERIFGPTKDWECSCGKYKRIKHKGVICDRCGVEVTLSKVRRERMGHIELAVPVSHIWFFKCTPSRLGLMMDITTTSLERVLYYEDYMVVDPGDTPLTHKQMMSEIECREAVQKFGENAFTVKTGAEAVRDVLAATDLGKFMEELEEAMDNTRNKQTRKKLSKQMKLAEGFRTNGTRPEWMILDVLPVIPPELRPLVPLEGGRFATSDLNDLYRRVINRNNRLKNLQQLKTPNVIIRNEKRMLQEAVDAVFDNGRHGRAVTGAGNRPLKSLSDMLRGKSGRFRQNLLGKRVDYSGRSVIVVGPELKLNQCGLPQKMALVLFEPFIIKRLKDMGVVHTVRGAKKLIERRTDQVWDVLEDVIKNKTVMLNRAPTLHRLSIQSFEPVLIEGEAIQIHPLVCTAFNADFDGDQMSVHVPLSIEAQQESRLLMLSTNNIFSPSSGRSMMTPTQDIALGLYYLTDLSQSEKRRRLSKPNQAEEEEQAKRMPVCANAEEVRLAHEDGALGIHDLIRFKNPDRGRETIHGDRDSNYIVTTPGRVFFNEIWPPEIGFVNAIMNKNMVGDLISDCYGVASHKRLVKALDALKTIGFEYATLAGVSIGLVDMIIPTEKKTILDRTKGQVDAVRHQYRQGIVTDGERHNKVLDIWTQATDDVADAMYRAIEINQNSDECNPVFMMVDSKARGSRQQIRQLCGIRGLMAKPSGEIIERPIISNFREGLSVLEYFISTHGARKGLADTALKTADAGYLTRKLVDVAHDVIIVEHDCNTVNGIEVGAMMEGDEVLIPLRQRVVGRTALNDIADPVSGQIIVAAGDEIKESDCNEIEKRGIDSLRIRSVLTCESRRGLCMRCYGRDLTTGQTVDVGTAVGTIAAQSIGEPGTQLTLRTFHIGGTASSIFKQPEIVSKKGGIVRHHDLRVVRNPSGNFVALNKNGVISVHDESGHEVERFTTAIGAQIFVEDGGRIEPGGLLAKWDPYSVPILAEQEGQILFHDFIENVSVKREVDEATGTSGIVVLENKQALHPQIIIKSASSDEVLGFYSIPTGARVMVDADMTVHPGDLLARTPRKESKTRDIVGGLPRVAELFEARQPKDAAEIARIEGLVDFGENQRGKRCLVIRDEITGGEEEHLIPMGKHIIVFKGDKVKKGQQLTDGPIVPQEILDVCGPQELQEYLVREVQQVYRLQGVEINDKHVEVIVRQMLRKVKITNPGDTEFLWGDQVMKQTFIEVNEAAKREGKRPAEATPALLGITKASLSTESFISAASFQDTTRVLTEAATLGRVDELRGFKENVIMGHLIPGGTGFPMYRNIKLVPLAEPIAEDPAAEETEARNEAEKKLKDLLG